MDVTSQRFAVMLLHLNSEHRVHVDPDVRDSKKCMVKHSVEAADRARK